MKNNKFLTRKNRVLLFAIACSAPYLGLLQPAIAQQFTPQNQVLKSFSSYPNYDTTPSAWSNVFLNIESSTADLPSNFANYRAPKFQFNTAQSSLGLRLGYRLSPRLSVSGYYGASKFGQSISAPSNAFMAESPFKFTPSFYTSRFNSTHASVDLAAQVGVFKRLTLFGSAGLMNYNHAEYGNAKLAKLGIGMQYDFNSRLGLRLEMERLRLLGTSGTANLGGSFSAFNSPYGNLDSYSLGAVFKF